MPAAVRHAATKCPDARCLAILAARMAAGRCVVFRHLNMLTTPIRGLAYLSYWRRHEIDIIGIIEGYRVLLYQ